MDRIRLEVEVHRIDHIIAEISVDHSLISVFFERKVHRVTVSAAHDHNGVTCFDMHFTHSSTSY